MTTQDENIKHKLIIATVAAEAFAAVESRLSASLESFREGKLNEWNECATHVRGADNNWCKIKQHISACISRDVRVYVCDWHQRTQSDGVESEEEWPLYKNRNIIVCPSRSESIVCKCFCSRREGESRFDVNKNGLTSKPFICEREAVRGKRYFESLNCASFCFLPSFLFVGYRAASRFRCFIHFSASGFSVEFWTR